jgi:expansin (peptidoglycan-binding protein)
MIVGGAHAQAGYQSSHTGQGTFYGYGGGGNCSFPLPSGVLTAAMNAVDYNGAQACGGYIEVTNLNTSQSVVVRIDDQCPGCAVGNVDLSQSAFAQISPLAAGQIPISWKYVSGPSTTAKVVFKDGSSQWWAGIQVRDHRNPVATLAYRATGSSSAYTPVEREAYNYFIGPSGMGAGPYDLQITDVFGQVITVSGIGLVVSTEIALGAQFPLVLPAGDSSSSGSSGSGSPLPVTTAVSVNNDWGQGYCDNVSVTNPNTTPLNWTVSLTIDGTMYTFWNAKLSQAGSTITGDGVSWNQTLAAGASTQFGYCANR